MHPIQTPAPTPKPTHQQKQERARRRKIREQVAASKAVEGRRAAGAKGLFALLPKPKAEEALGACVGVRGGLNLVVVGVGLWSGLCVVGPVLP